MSPEYVIAAYTITIATILGYTIWVLRRERVLEEEVQVVAAEVEAEHFRDRE